MVPINYWWHRHNNTIAIINDWIQWTILDDVKVLLQLGMGLKDIPSLYSNIATHSTRN